MARLKPQRGKRRPFYRGLAFKLGLVSLTLLAIPWAGYRYLTETESFLRMAQEESLLERAEMLAGLIVKTAKPQLESYSRQAKRDLANSLYAHPLHRAVQLDGYAEEWQPLLEQRRHFRASELRPDALAFDLLLGFRDRVLSLYVRVYDRSRRYARTETDPAAGDHLLLVLPDLGDGLRRAVIGTPAPGWVVARDIATGSTISDIRGEWQETPQGYDVELRLPLALTGPDHLLSLAVVDRQEGYSSPIAATSGLENRQHLSSILIPSAEIQSSLALTETAGFRSLVLTAQRQVIGRQGQLIPSAAGMEQGLLERLLSLHPAFATEELLSQRQRLGELDGPEIRRALSGIPTTYRYHAGSRSPGFLSAAYPLQGAEGILGVVVIEQSSQGILSLRHKALANLLEISLVLFLVTGLSLLAFSSRLTGRITSLSGMIERSVSGEGRIRHELPPTREADEIGDLARSFAAVMTRLQEYNHYLEAMSARLAHELRTPLATVKSSLENLAQVAAEADRNRYLERAHAGLHRLSLILDSMREASRLEQSLQLAEREDVNLARLADAMSDSYRTVYPDVRFECRLPGQAVTIRAAPDLIAQALDKLVANAVDFHRRGTPIVVAVEQPSASHTLLKVCNQGPPLPQGMKDQLFFSMVSVRNRHDDQPHLGLGLHLVRLIAEFHQGRAIAEELEEGVCFTLQFKTDELL